MSLGENWYTEKWAGQGSAISLEIEEKLYDQQSDFQRIEIYQSKKFGRVMTLDGLVMLTEKDHFIYHEMLVHPALFSRPDIRNLLIIGGGDCGALTEAVKHPGVRSVTQVELDAAVTEVGLKYFAEFKIGSEDPRVNLQFADGIQWVEQAEAGIYDAIIIDSTDPVGPAEGLFSAAFFSACKRALSQNGVVAIQSESPLFHAELIIEIHQRLQQAGFADSASLTFPQCTYPSGWWSSTLAVKQGRADQFQTQASAKRPFSTRYYNQGIHQAAFALPEFLRAQLQT